MGFSSVSTDFVGFVVVCVGIRLPGCSLLMLLTFQINQIVGGVLTCALTTPLGMWLCDQLPPTGTLIRTMSLLACQCCSLISRDGSTGYPAGGRFPWRA